jgi:hypothetical protein
MNPSNILFLAVADTLSNKEAAPLKFPQLEKYPITRRDAQIDFAKSLSTRCEGVLLPRTGDELGFTRTAAIEVDRPHMHDF